MSAPRTTSHPFPSASSPGGFSYAQSGSASPNIYYDIETLTLGKSRAGKKTAKERPNKSSIWSDSPSNPQNQETLKIVKSGKKSKGTSQTNSKANSKKTEEASSSNEKTFLGNPLLENGLKNWTLPRVELWCRDPKCVYNQRLWGNHYQHSPGYSPVAISIPEKVDEEEEYQTDHTRSTYCNLRSGSDTNSNSSGTQSHHDVSNHPTMVLNNSKRNANPNQTGQLPSTRGGQMHLNMTMGINNFGSKDGITITHTNNHNNSNSKAEKTFTNPHKERAKISSNNNNNNNSNKMTLTQTPSDTLGSSISSNSNTDTTILTINTGIGSSAESAISPEGSSASTFITGFDTSTSTTGSGSGGDPFSKPVGRDIAVGAGHNQVNTQGNTTNTVTSSTGSFSNSSSQDFRTHSAASSSNPFCPNCSGVVPLNHLDNNESDLTLGRMKGDPGFWNFNKFQHPLQRDHSFHSVGGFTLNGQYNTIAKKPTMVKFCSSHKISLVVSTFSLLVTIGLLITLFLMKKRGMMDTMMDS